MIIHKGKVFAQYNLFKKTGKWAIYFRQTSISMSTTKQSWILSKFSTLWNNPNAKVVLNISYAIFHDTSYKYKVAHKINYIYKQRLRIHLFILMSNKTWNGCFPWGSFFIFSIKSSRQLEKNLYPTILCTSKLPSTWYTVTKHLSLTKTLEKRLKPNLNLIVKKREIISFHS